MRKVQTIAVVGTGNSWPNSAPQPTPKHYWQVKSQHHRQG